MISFCLIISLGLFGQTVEGIEALVKRINSNLNDESEVEKISIERNGKAVSISKQFNNSFLRLSVNFSEGDDRRVKAFIIRKDELIYFSEYRILGDEIPRMERAKSYEFSAVELERAEKTISDKSEYYFNEGQLFCSRTEKKSRSGQSILEELKTYLDAFQ